MSESRGLSGSALVDSGPRQLVLVRVRGRSIHAARREIGQGFTGFLLSFGSALHTSNPLPGGEFVGLAVGFWETELNLGSSQTVPHLVWSSNWRDESRNNIYPAVSIGGNNPIG
jgi:hypothetical protein